MTIGGASVRNRGGEAAAGGRVVRRHPADVAEEERGRAATPLHQPARQAGAHAAQAHQVHPTIRASHPPRPAPPPPPRSPLCVCCSLLSSCSSFRESQYAPDDQPAADDALASLNGQSPHVTRHTTRATPLHKHLFTSQL